MKEKYTYALLAVRTAKELLDLDIDFDVKIRDLLDAVESVIILNHIKEKDEDTV